MTPDQLGGDIDVAHDRSGNQLRKHGHIGSEGDERCLRFRFAAINIDRVAHGLKRIEADADGQAEVKQGYKSQAEVL